MRPLIVVSALLPLLLFERASVAEKPTLDPVDAAILDEKKIEDGLLDPSALKGRYAKADDRWYQRYATVMQALIDAYQRGYEHALVSPPCKH
jgi:hypothetical protein